MTIKAENIQDYITQIPEERKEPFTKLYDTLKSNLPAGLTEGMLYNMPGFYISLEDYPYGYRANKKVTPLPFINIASQKNYIALYHMGMYAHQPTYQWFVDEYPKHSKYKLDMGKSCVRFKKPDAIPFELIAELASKMSVDKWIQVYEENLAKK
ncbi:DUF1801 domain-containing protein [Nonlabens tegetincola]|uniref:DUF1801 domain-containing protein n=1 Tax=Nonlabens tegetincola TaxID=323273 RepID=A0A090Q5P6_9FLAO|nr:DUF1801 domain-containing protein [Nonlabens tegetincola]GAK97068.1 DUF1801 domain-containing protein [Nonlabens tegetincola]